MINFIDSHSHIHNQQDFPDFADVLLRAQQAGVTRQVIVGCDLNDSLAAMKLAQNNDGLDYTIGVHPHDAKNYSDETTQTFEKIILGLGDFADVKKRPVAIGEIGLDYFKNLSSVESQKDAFKHQLDIARRFDLPVVLHVRDAFKDVFQILDEFKLPRVLFHCFAGGLEEMKWVRERGYLLSFSGIVTYPKAEQLQNVAKKIDLAGFLIETDCPYLSPQKLRGQRNEPAFVVETAKFIAEIRNEKLEQIALKTLENTMNFFGLKNFS